MLISDPSSKHEHSADFLAMISVPNRKIPDLDDGTSLEEERNAADNRGETNSHESEKRRKAEQESHSTDNAREYTRDGMLRDVMLEAKEKLSSEELRRIDTIAETVLNKQYQLIN